MGSRARPPQPAADWRRSKPDRVSERFISKLKTAIKSNDEPISIGPGTLLIPAWAQGLANGSAAALIGAGLFLAGTRTVTGSLVGFMFGVPDIDVRSRCSTSKSTFRYYFVPLQAAPAPGGAAICTSTNVALSDSRSRFFHA